MQVSHISQTNDFVCGDLWLLVVLEAITGTIQPVYIKWLEEEPTLEIGQPEMVLVKFQNFCCLSIKFLQACQNVHFFFRNLLIECFGS